MKSNDSYILALFSDTRHTEAMCFLFFSQKLNKLLIYITVIIENFQ